MYWTSVCVSWTTSAKVPAEFVCCISTVQYGLRFTPVCKCHGFESGYFCICVCSLDGSASRFFLLLDVGYFTKFILVLCFFVQLFVSV